MLSIYEQQQNMSTSVSSIEKSKKLSKIDNLKPDYTFLPSRKTDQKKTGMSKTTVYELSPEYYPAIYSNSLHWIVNQKEGSLSRISLTFTVAAYGDGTDDYIYGNSIIKNLIKSVEFKCGNDMSFTYTGEQIELLLETIRPEERTHMVKLLPGYGLTSTQAKAANATSGGSDQEYEIILPSPWDCDPTNLSGKINMISGEILNPIDIYISFNTQAAWSAGENCVITNPKINITRVTLPSGVQQQFNALLQSGEIEYSTEYYNRKVQSVGTSDTSASVDLKNFYGSVKYLMVMLMPTSYIAAGTQCTYTDISTISALSIQHDGSKLIDYDLPLVSIKNQNLKNVGDLFGYSLASDNIIVIPIDNNRIRKGKQTGASISFQNDGVLNLTFTAPGVASTLFVYGVSEAVLSVNNGKLIYQY